MALVTYGTRVGGYVLLRHARLSGRAAAWLHYIPGAVIMAIIAPSVVPNVLFGGSTGESGALTAGAPEALAAVATTFVAARSKNLLLAMITGVISVLVFRWMFGG
jgi:uncharacterized membrane protein